MFFLFVCCHDDDACRYDGNSRLYHNPHQNHHYNLLLHDCWHCNDIYDYWENHEYGLKSYFMDVDFDVDLVDGNDEFVVGRMERVFSSSVDWRRNVSMIVLWL